MLERSTSPGTVAVTWREGLFMACIAAVYLAAMLHLAANTGITVDEPSHIVSSILYWEGNDTLYPGDMPPLIKIAGGALAASADFRIVEESAPAWAKRHEWTIGLDMIRRMTERQIRESMFRARLGLMIFPLATMLLIWWWGRELLSPAAGVAIAALFAMEPTALGHSVLFKNDHAATFGYLLFWYRAWRFWQRPSLANLSWMAAAGTLGMLAKLSMLLLVLIAPCLAMIRLRGMRMVYGLVVAAAIPYALSALACQFDLRPLTPEELAGEATRGHLPWFVLRAVSVFQWLPIPIRLWQGFSSLLFNNGHENAVYFMGARHSWGHPAYFAVAALVKCPEPLLLAIAGGAVVLLRDALRRVLRVSDLLWIGPGLLYFALASYSGLQLGFRLILPCLPFALLIAGHLLRTLPAWGSPVLLCTMLAVVAPQHPHVLSYFNAASGGPKNATKYLSDSNVDWGQNLRELRRYMQREKILGISLSYFGSDNVFAYFRPGQVDWISPPYGGTKPATAKFEPGPGIYAISATLLTGQFADPPYRDYYAAFRAKQPIAYAGQSIFIYRFP
ncbi:MAG: glycosyltransferase family 39 protein [Bryobacterales bacterium]|nr:glycosyltransferase family 39 protein [Bryobacterales bacterium]